MDLREYDLPHFDEEMSPKMLGDGAYANESVARWTRDVEEMDGLVIVGPEYNHGYSPVLKSALDYVYAGWVRKPVTFIGYGNMGGARAIEQLRQVVVELQMAPLSNAVHLPVAPLWAHVTGGDAAPLLVDSDDKATELVAELLWWTRALRVAREVEFLALAS